MIEHLRNWLRTNGLLRYMRLELLRRKLNPIPVRHIVRYFERSKIETVIDAGANIGQFASELRFFGFSGEVISLEPSKKTFEALAKKATRDKNNNWKVLNVGLSDRKGSQTLHISANAGLSSSLLRMDPLHEVNFPNSKYIDSEEIIVITLSDLVRDSELVPSKSALKLDLQGFEGMVISFESELISSFAYIYFEASLKLLYEGEYNLAALIGLLNNSNHDVVEIFRSLRDSNMDLIQVDILTRNRNLND